MQEIRSHLLCVWVTDAERAVAYLHTQDRWMAISQEPYGQERSQVDAFVCPILQFLQELFKFDFEIVTSGVWNSFVKQDRIACKA